jgi:hypothetical protein
MTITRSFPFVVAACAAAVLACGGTSSDDPAAFMSAARARLTPWTFTKIPTTPATQNVAAPVQGLDALVFEMTGSAVKGDVVKAMAFMITGTLQAGSLTSFQLVYFPAGLKKPGVVVGTNDGSSWAPGPTTSIVSIDLTSPITTGPNFKADFILRVDVNGAGSFFFTPELRTATVDVGGVPTLLTGATCDLPLPGDTFYVN